MRPGMSGFITTHSCSPENCLSPGKPLPLYYFHKSLRWPTKPPRVLTETYCWPHKLKQYWEAVGQKNLIKDYTCIPLSLFSSIPLDLIKSDRTRKYAVQVKICSGGLHRSHTDVDPLLKKCSQSSLLRPDFLEIVHLGTTKIASTPSNGKRDMGFESKIISSQKYLPSHERESKNQKQTNKNSEFHSHSATLYFRRKRHRDGSRQRN